MHIDTLNNRPLPKWLIDQKEGLTYDSAPENEMRDDNSLRISFAVTGLIIIY